jgi:hypothetical protein
MEQGVHAEKADLKCATAVRQGAWRARMECGPEMRDWELASSASLGARGVRRAAKNAWQAR